MAGGSKGRRSAKKAEKAPKGGGAELPEGVTVLEGAGERAYSFEVAGNKVFLSTQGSESSVYVSFSVNGSYDRRNALQGRDADKAAIKIAKIMRYDVSTRPEGFKYITTAYTSDGYGARRAEAYARMGFSRPERAGNVQGAIVNNGKLTPYTP